MPINSTLDVVIQQDDLVVLGPPTSVDIALDIGAQGDPGSQIYVGDFDPNSITISQFETLYGLAPQGNDLFLRNEIGVYYGVFYSYVNIPGGEQWEPVLEIQDAVELFLNSNSGFILSASAGGTGVDNGTNTFTFSGDVNFAGGYPVTFNSSSATNLTLPVSGDVAVHQDKLNVFASTTSAELASVISNETGTGLLVFSTSPNLSTSITTDSSSFNLLNTTATTLNFAGAATNLIIGANEAGTTTIRNASTNLTGDLTVSGSDIIATESTFNLIDTTATTVNFAGAATNLNIGANTGTTTVNNDLVVDGDLTVNGSTTVINSTITTLDDPILVLGGDSPPVEDDNKDRGIEFNWHDGTSAKAGFFGFDDSTGRFTFIPDATNTSEVFSGTLGDIEVGDIIADNLAVSGTITGDVTGNLTGNALTATALETARVISLAGDVSGSASFNGTSDITITAIVDSLSSVNSITGTPNEIDVSASVGDITISLPTTIDADLNGTAASATYAITAGVANSVVANSVTLGTDTIGNYIANISGTSNEIEVSGSGSESASVVIGLPDDVIIANDLTVGGNLTVSGSVVYLNVSELLVEDNIITLNSSVTGSPTLDAGIEVERGTDPNVSIQWNETLDQWEFTNDGTTYLALGSGTGDGGFTNHFLTMGA